MSDRILRWLDGKLPAIGGFLVFCLIASMIVVGTLTPKDDSDPADGRSGFIIYTDHLTGCQYLRVAHFDSITPRLSQDGKPLCKS